MDVQPQDINPDIVELAKVNPKIREIFSIYLSCMPAYDDKPLTWRHALELMVLKLGQQYGGALEGWKDAVTKQEPQKPDQLLLVNENEPEVEVVPPSPVEDQLRIAKGMLAKLVSPARLQYIAEGGSADDFPPIQLSKSFIEQIAHLIGTGNIDAYKAEQPCPECTNHAWFIENNVRKCAVCESRKQKRSADYRRQQLSIAIDEFLMSEGKKREKLDKLMSKAG